MSGDCDICGRWSCVEANHIRIERTNRRTNKMKLKTAEEWFEKYSTGFLDSYGQTWLVLPKGNFEKALAKDRQQVKDLIDEMIVREKKVQEGWNDEDFSFAIIQSGINRLTELKAKL